MRNGISMILLAAIAAAPSLLWSQDFIYDAKDRRDPLRPLVDREGNILPEARPVTANVDLSLEGIVWSRGGNSYALIGGSVVRAGDMLGDYKVKAIERTRVILERGPEQSVIDLRSEEE